MSNRTRRLGLVAALASVSAGFLTTACTADDGGGDAKGEIAFFSLAFTNPYEQAHQRAIEEAAKELDYSVTVFDANGNGTTQYDQIQSAIASGRYDGFIIDPASSAVFPAITEAGSAGIKVYCALLVCGDDPSSIKPQVEGQTGFAGVSEADTGRLQVEMFAEVCRGVDPCKVGYVQGAPSVPTDQARTAALKEALKDHPTIELVGVVDGAYDRGTSYNAARDLFSAHPDLTAVAAGADQMLFGVQQAADEAGIDVALIGNAGSKEGVQAVCDGDWYGAGLDLPVTAGKETVVQLVNSINDSDFEAVIDPRELAGMQFVTQENACDVEAEWSAEGN